MASPEPFIHQFIPGKSDRTLVFFHSTGGDEAEAAAMGRQLDPDAALLCPRGKVIENGRNRFFRRICQDVFDEEDVQAKAYELSGFIDFAAEQYGFDPARVFVAGYSHGAEIAAALLLLKVRGIQGAVLLRPMVPIVPETMPDLHGVRVSIAAGENDPVVHPADTMRLVSLLRKSGALVTDFYSDAGHELAAGEIGTLRQWISAETS